LLVWTWDVGFWAGNVKVFEFILGGAIHGQGVCHKIWQGPASVGKLRTKEKTS
jgi:hypothetical protein